MSSQEHDKTETILPDGTRIIRYGNSKATLTHHPEGTPFPEDHPLKQPLIIPLPNGMPQWLKKHKDEQATRQKETEPAESTKRTANNTTHVHHQEDVAMNIETELKKLETAKDKNFALSVALVTMSKLSLLEIHDAKARSSVKKCYEYYAMFLEEMLGHSSSDLIMAANMLLNGARAEAVLAALPSSLSPTEELI